ncbi:DUF5780 domain-containing protein [Butyrivibrio sp. AE3006]|uniref:DUF5780 domain-containing protein n=1 Tax=Butyrivibrio sp. AE3006 TaxID=1280673 RepID=UPI000427B4C1|nr:DUF5780 domain-containing protein [Butyrivibrio sp. AE3006]
MKRLVATIILCSMLLTACGGAGGSGNQAKVKEQIWTNVQPQVAELLKFPDSAEFGSYEDAIIVEEDGKYHIIGEVMGKNGFGMQVSNGFEAYATPGDGGYTFSDVTVFDAATYQSKKKIFEQKLARQKSGESMLSNSELDEKVKTQDLYVSQTSILRKDDLYIASGDMMQAIIYNNSDKKIAEAVVAFAAWDKNNLPVKIQKPYGIGTGDYITEVTYSNVNLLKGQSYGDDSGYEVSTSPSIQKIRAIVVSYQTTDGEKWENPYYIDFVEANEGKEY